MHKLLIAALSFIFTATPALACTVAQGYRVPTNFELIERADLVVLARVESQTSPDPAEWFKPNVWLSPIRAIKGALPRTPLGLRGTVTNRGVPVLPQPTALDQVHASTMWGACIRQVYAKDTLVIATFVKGKDGGYIQIAAPFSRAVEDVESENGLWVRTATLYATMQGRPGERAAVIKAEVTRLEGLAGDPEAAAIAADLRRNI